MTTTEYLSYSKPKRVAIDVGNFFVNVPKAIWRFIKKIPKFFARIGKKLFKPVYFLFDTFIHSDWIVRLSYLICGFGQFMRKEKARGILVFIYEIFYIVYMALIGGNLLSNLATLGVLAYISTPSGKVNVTSYPQNSFSILLFAIVTIIFSGIMLYLWYASIKASKILYDNSIVGKYSTDKKILYDLVGKQYHTVLLTIPMVGLAVFTIIPIIFMILIGFTNYNSYHLPPTSLFEWVGFYNYSEIFSTGTSNNLLFLTTFLQVLLWTLIWAFFATFSNYFLGMIMALIINRKGIKLKKLWRTILIITIAVPQFVSLLLIQRMLNTDLGIVNQILMNLGWTSTGIKWLNDPIITKVTIIIVNTWIGIPYTMLICTGILMNIPADLYESAKIDGASPFKAYMKITLPYMLFVTGPYLISQFVGNINNFNVIYLLSQGNPLFTFAGQTVPTTLTGVGQTDLLITWIYKITMTNTFKDYGTASVLGVMVFAIVAFFSLIFYGRSSAVKNEEDFQ